MAKRLTINKLSILLNEMFERYEIDCKVDRIVKTRFRSYDYEGGACTFHVWVKHKDGDGLFLLFSWLKEMESMINDGYKPCLSISRGGAIDDQITFKKLKP